MRAGPENLAAPGQGSLVVVATYDERENIGPLISMILDFAPGAQVLVIDDNSPDGTADAVRDLAATDHRVALLQRPAKLGLGSAYMEGFRQGLARDADRVITMDADLSHHPRHLPAILSAATEPGVDVVIGSRYIPGGGVVGWPIVRRLLSFGANAFARTLLGLSAHDNTGAYRSYSRPVLERLTATPIVSDGYSALLELIWHCQRTGYRIREVPITFTDRVHGQSKVSRMEIFRGLTTVLRLRFRPPQPAGAVDGP